MFYSHHNCPVASFLFIHTKKFVGFSVAQQDVKLCNNNKNNNNNKTNKKRGNRKGAGGGGASPLPRTGSSSPKCSVGPRPLSAPLSPPHPSGTPAGWWWCCWQGTEEGGALQPAPPERPPLPFLLTGALLPQSSEMERRLKMGRRRPGSRLGDSEPLRLPELSEPLR